MLQNIIPNIQYPSAYSNWMDLALNYSEQNKELAICGELALDYSKKINTIYLYVAVHKRNGQNLPK